MVDIENFEPKNSHDRKLKEMLQHFWLPNALFAAVELDIAELLKTGSKSISKLALLANSNEESLYKLLRLSGILRGCVLNKNKHLETV